MERKEGLLERSWVAGVTATEVMFAHVVAQFAVMVVQVRNLNTMYPDYLLQNARFCRTDVFPSNSLPLGISCPSFHDICIQCAGKRPYGMGNLFNYAPRTLRNGLWPCSKVCFYIT